MAATVLHDWEGIWVNANATNTKPTFDISGSHPVLLENLAMHASGLHNVLVPGCGRGYDVATLSRAGMNALGLEISSTAVETANAFLKETGAVVNASVVLDDFFSHKPAQPYDLVYDYTFLCALHPTLRAAWASQMSTLIRPGGQLWTMQFPLRPYPAGSEEDLNRGPPFQLSPALYHTLLDEHFECLEEYAFPEEKSVEKRRGFERFARWQRKQ